MARGGRCVSWEQGRFPAVAPLQSGIVLL